MVKNQGVSRILSSIAFETVKSLRQAFFHFQIFETLEKLEIDFSINLNRCFGVMLLFG